MGSSLFDKLNFEHRQYGTARRRHAADKRAIRDASEEELWHCAVLLATRPGAPSDNSAAIIFQALLEEQQKEHDKILNRDAQRFIRRVRKQVARTP